MTSWNGNWSPIQRPSAPLTTVRWASPVRRYGSQHSCPHCQMAQTHHFTYLTPILYFYTLGYSSFRYYHVNREPRYRTCLNNLPCVQHWLSPATRAGQLSWPPLPELQSSYQRASQLTWPASYYCASQLMWPTSHLCAGQPNWPAGQSIIHLVIGRWLTQLTGRPPACQWTQLTGQPLAGWLSWLVSQSIIQLVNQRQQTPKGPFTCRDLCPSIKISTPTLESPLSGSCTSHL